MEPHQLLDGFETRDEELESVRDDRRAVFGNTSSCTRINHHRPCQFLSPKEETYWMRDDEFSPLTSDRRILLAISRRMIMDPLRQLKRVLR